MRLYDREKRREIFSSSVFSMHLTNGIFYLLFVSCYFIAGCGLFRKPTPMVFVSGSYPVRPGWSKKTAYEGGDFMYFTGISDYRENEKKARESAIDNGVKFLLKYAGLEDERVLELFRADLSPKIIAADKNKDKGPYEVVVSDFYLEKYMIKKTKRLCYKGYVQLRFPFSKWLELRSYVRATTEQKYNEKFYEH